MRYFIQNQFVTKPSAAQDSEGHRRGYLTRTFSCNYITNDITTKPVASCRKAAENKVTIRMTTAG